jgi:hypothetical protein
MEVVGSIATEHRCLEDGGELKRGLGEEALLVAFLVRVSTKLDFIDRATEKTVWHEGVQCDRRANLCPFDRRKKSKGAPWGAPLLLLILWKL